MKSITVNGARLSYTDEGTGVPLVCLHGGMGIDSASLRVPGILNLARTGVRLVIPDQRGHGRSERSSIVDYTHQKWIDDVHALGQALGLSRFALLGHSYGGFLALEYARRWPGTLSHLILVATSPGPVAAAAALVRSEQELRDHFRAAWPRFFAREEKHWPLFESLQFSADAYIAAFLHELPRYDVRPDVPAITVPTLLVVGDEDWYHGPMEWLAANLPTATLRVLEHVGHFPFVEAEEAFANAVREFLSARS